MQPACSNQARGLTKVAGEDDTNAEYPKPNAACVCTCSTRSEKGSPALDGCPLQLERAQQPCRANEQK